MKKGLSGIKATSVKLHAEQDLVQIREFAEGQTLPVLITPLVPGVDVLEWCKTNKSKVEELLLQHGGILFRGFDVSTQERFDEYVSGMCEKLLVYNESSSPRTKLTGKVYTSTEHPKELVILQHNELSYSSTWPQKIWFCSVKEAETGGATPLADMRRVYEQIDPAIRARFEEKGWMLVRNYGDGFGLPWQDVFHTEDKSEVETYCATHGIEVEWKPNGLLRTRQKRKAVRFHPVTGEKIWFNHASFWHVSSLEPEIRDLLVDELGLDGLPYNTYYGDGTPIEDETAAAIRAVIEAETIAFPWQRGDLLVLDNMLVSHGRESFTGERKTLVAMGEPLDSAEADEIDASFATR
ncbi:TauD/TfdA family dioxygenase [Tumebacillus flagellatus]|uniref:Taurine catabolism dioxygenase TauD n=1 Tax=Tumebacillus flagellatus TaxID=1157490 RepID=A0A074LTR8_9BACL|nr:TauD/TfdA family dioxygenase [Tumebacillus flagellatus]KEO84025.1 taurine catabolism dioxygenase TauD [Tumebacillus flagellatus]